MAFESENGLRGNLLEKKGIPLKNSKSLIFDQILFPSTDTYFILNWLVAAAAWLKTVSMKIYSAGMAAYLLAVVYHI